MDTSERSECREFLALHPETEQELTERAGRGDDLAFDALFRHYQPLVARYTRSRLPSMEDAEDVTQEVFMLAHRALPRFEWQDVPFGAWLLAIARRRVQQYWRVRGRHPQAPLDERQPAMGEGPEEAAERADAHRHTLAAVDRLPVSQRQAVHLRLHGLSHREIATAMGRTETNVRVLHHRAVTRLKRVLAPKLRVMAG